MRWYKQSVIFILILTASSSFAVDRAKLTLLDPLPSVRLTRIAENADKTKLLWTAGYGLAGGWMIWNNVSKGYDAYRVNNVLAGSTLFVTAAVDYMVPNSYKIDLELLNDLNVKDEEKESMAYFEIKSKARSSFVTRRSTALMYLLSTLSSVVIAGSSPNLTDNERFFTNLNAVGFLCLAAYELFYPSEVEVEADKMDKELAK